MTKPLRYGTWDYDSALQTIVREVYRNLSINQNRNEDCLFMGQIAWEGTFAIKMDKGADLDATMSALLEDQEPNVEHRQALLRQWKQDVADIERFFDKEQENDDEENNSPQLNRVGNWLADLRQKSQDMFSYADDTERKSS